MSKNKVGSGNLATGIILNSVADGVFTVDNEWKITSFNRAAENVTGISAGEAIGRLCKEVFHSNICDGACILKDSIETGNPITNQSIYIIRADGEKLPISISAAPLVNSSGEVIGGVETFRDISEITELRKELEKKYTFQDIISKNAAMQKIFQILPQVAQSDSTVLIQGESGTGKELVARAIHNLSDRNNGPMVAVNCGALPDTLLESELFGYKAGAFTDAKKDKPGFFSRAEKGSIFLDEIGDISPALQVRLLRVLQEKTYEPLGATAPVRADVRVITATNKNLDELVREGKFRSDLFYRLNVVPLKILPLRERKEDIPLLVQHFIQRFRKIRGKDITGLSRDSLALLMRDEYQGNIRELENIIEYAFILCPGGQIFPEHLPEKFHGQRINKGLDFLPGVRLEEIKKQAVIKALERNNGKRLVTCRELGISKSTLRRMMIEYGLTAEKG